MSIKKSLLTLAAAAMATMALASPAMATDGVLRDTSGTSTIPGNTVLHLVGWTKFTTVQTSYECHLTLNIKVIGGTGTTGEVTAFAVPDKSKCIGGGLFNGCTLKSHEANNLPYHVTITDNGRVDITGNIEIHSTYSGCLMKTTMRTYKEIQLTPLKTGTRAVTGTENTLGETAGLNEAIAGFEFDGFNEGAEVHMESIFGAKSSEAITGIPGELELTSDTRCTYEISAT